MLAEILSHFQNNGLIVDDLILDGKFHRFKVNRKDHKKSGWYLGFQNYAPSSGEQFHVVRYGNHQTNEEFQYQTDGSKFTPQDRAEINAQMAAAKVKAQKKLEEHWETVSQELTEWWNGAESEEGVGEYLERKGLTSKYGAKLVDGTLYIPMQDVHGRLWSMQKIERAKYPNERGEYTMFKGFAPGGKIQECFFVIGDLDSDDSAIRIVEGFATGASVYEAVQQPVVVAFNTSLLPGVADVIRRRFPEREIIICGDDDRWNTRVVDGETVLYNAGRSVAETTAERIGGVAVFPKFRDDHLEQRPTDFDDLRILEGIESVREQLTGIVAPKRYIAPLGYDEGNYYFVSNVNPQIQKLNAQTLCSLSGLLRLQPLAYWELLYPSKTGVNTSEAGNHLMQRCHDRGVFRPERVRGQGVWSDEGRVVFHRGEEIVTSTGEAFELHNSRFKSRFIYELDQALPPIHPDPLSKEECELLLEAVGMVRWKRPDSFRYLAGWLAVAPLGGALQWRPHVWVTGPSGSGKSYIMQDIVHPLLKNMCRYFLGRTTEAGIRQTIGRSTRPLMFDEFETNDETSALRVRSILELARQASSDSDGIVAMGSSAGNAVRYKPQFSMIAGSIRTQLITEEDRNRFAVLELNRGSGDADDRSNFEHLKSLTRQLHGEYGERLFARMMKFSPQLKASIETLVQVLAESNSMRYAQQYGTLLAGYWMLIDDEPISREYARELVATIHQDDRDEVEEMPDEREALEALLTTKLTLDLGEVGRQELSGAEALEAVRYRHLNWSLIQVALRRIGIHASPESGVIVASDSHMELDIAVYSRTKWSKIWTRSLRRVENSESRVFKGGEGKTIRGTFLPWNSVLK